MMDYYAAARREAERLRIVLDVFANAHPTMTLDEALPAILAAEKRAAELEAPEMPKEQVRITLPDTMPQTIASFIDLQEDIQQLIHDGMTINAIKEARARLGTGLKETKDGVLHWKNRRPSSSS